MIIEIPYVEHQFHDIGKNIIIRFLQHSLSGDTHSYFALPENVRVMRELHENGIIKIIKSGRVDGHRNYLVSYSRTNKTLLYINILKILMIMEK